jgi:ribonuclease R
MDPLEEIKEKIVHFFAKYPAEQFKPRVIAHRLAIKEQSEIRKLQQALNELYQAKTIIRGNRKRYGYASPPISNRLVGILKTTRQKTGIVELLAPNEGKVSIEQRFMHTALDGDTVSVALFAQQGRSKKEEQDLEGEIVDVVERTSKPIVGIFQKGKNYNYVVPDNSKIGRDIYIPAGKTHGARPGNKVVAQIESWETRNLNPEGAVLEILGKSGELRAEMSGIAREFRLPLKFPPEILKESEDLNETIPKSEIARRLDLRKSICFTIDPEDAKDFDDAVSLEKLPDGNFKLGVHIADVSYYVIEGSPLDREALKRGTSVYLADEVIPMLPEKLSNNLCSLRPKVDRLTYSVFMIISPKYVIKEYEIVKSVIHSKRRFTYEEVQKVIETGNGDFAPIISEMHRLSQALLKKRMKEGSIDFESVETKFRFDENGKPSEILKKERLDAHRLVEEFMLLANQTVAKYIGQSKKEENIRPFVYRVHDMPPPDKLADLASFVEHLGYSLNMAGGVTSKALQKLLKDVKGKEEENVINEVAIRSMAKAIYTDKNMGHFGLGFKYYTHFTSPIRRYPDLIVHRLLHEYENKMPHKRREELITLLPEICDQSSEMERVAMEAERASVKVMQVEYMKRHVGDTFHAIISGVTNFGLFVEITDLLVEGLIHVRDMEGDFYVYDEKQYSLTGRKSKKRYRLGDKIEIRVVRVDTEEREIDFSLVE